MQHTRSKQETKLNSNMMGIICIIASAFCFSLMSLFIRLSGDIPTMQKCFFRNVVAMIIAIAVLIREKQPLKIGKGNLKYLFARAIGGTLGLICNFYAIDHIPISDASILNKLSPFFAIIFSVFVLKEVANRFEWMAICIAFCGALLVVKPTFTAGTIPALIGVLGGCGAGFAYTFVRKLGKRGENSMIIVLFFSAFSTLICLPFMLMNAAAMSVKSLGFLICAGIFACVGQFGITRAYIFAPAKEISVYDYTQVIFAAVFGYFVFGQIPDALSVLGYCLICGAGIAMFFYNKKR